MKTWVGLLRGVNVGGARKLPMAELRILCAELGFTSVATYIQSGNVVFRADGDARDVEKALEDGIRERWGYEVPIVVRSEADLARIVETNPFLAAGHDVKTLHVGFLGATPAAAEVKAMPAPPAGPERWEVRGAEVFLLYPEGVGNSKLTGAWFEKALGTTMTSRNWRTVNKLLAMARDA